MREDVFDLSEQGDHEHESAPRLCDNGDLLSDLDAVVVEADGHKGYGFANIDKYVEDFHLF